MNKIKLAELMENNNWNNAVIVFTKDSFEKDFSEMERSYKVSKEDKYFNPSMGGTSLYGDCLDGQDNDVRLDIYMKLLPKEGKRWEVEYCYLID